ncbi:MAG TPA: helix-turn-helix domain-containing protein [Frankiaceae bacterium]|nr:helix-turn-helix domain-containing protein [Frankiaceae bacterium]
MRRTSFEDWPCSIARTADMLGDGWTLLVLREAFYGETRFDGFIEALSIARNTLTDRLRRLVDAGLLDRRPYQADPVRHDYALTEKGRDFFGVLAALNAWGDRWLAGEPGAPVLLRHDACGQDVHAEVVCGHCEQPLAPADVTPRPGPGYPQRLLNRPAVQRRFGAPLAAGAPGM